MNLDISFVQGLHAGVAPARGPARAGGADSARRADASAPVRVELSGDASGIPASPPDEVLDAMGTAAAAYDHLASVNRGLSFKIDDATGKVVVGVHDGEGKLLFTVPGSKALDVAAGGSIDE
ncbi:MAG TPA: hypothetical protein VE992_03960 [Solirubrobacteraceae bacterium]|nr:hypothetical protein [Solirubrobacteraceae bacterium]